MKKQVMILALMCSLAMGSEAQIYAGDTWATLPTMDLYDTGVMNMSLSNAAKMAEMRRQYYLYYGERAVDDYHNGRWQDAINNATNALKYAQFGVFYFIRGTAYENLGYYKAAKSDYKKSIKNKYQEAVGALERLKAKMEQMNRK